MSANDNILAGLAGIAEGVAGVYVPWVQAEHKANLEDRLMRNKLAAETGQKLSLLPYEEQSAIRKKNAELQSEYQQKRSLVPFQTDENIRQKRAEQNNMVPIVDEATGNVMDYTKQGGIKVNTKKGGKTLPQRQSDALTGIKNTIDALDTVITKSKTGKFETGPTSLRYSPTMIGNKYMGMVGSTPESQFKSDLTDLQAGYATGKTGTQRGFKEVQWLQSAMPNADLRPAQLVGVGSAARKRLIQNYKNAVGSAKASGFDVSQHEADLANYENEVATDDAPPDKYKVGEIQTGANGQKGKYLGNGKWQILNK